MVLSGLTMIAKTCQTFLIISVISGILSGPGMNVVLSMQDSVNSITCFMEN